jgi:hypothetical protein
MKNLFLVFVYFSILLAACRTEISSSALPISVIENVILNFEPDLNLVQTTPYHYEKQHADSAYISVKLEKYPDEWILKFWSSEVEILEFVEQDDYYSNHSSVFLNDTLIVSFSDIPEIKGVLDLQEELVSVLTIEL